jgi:EAL domain-containing protein (putative c-di-GMP-specific phosphodiesterase class I)
MQTVQMPKWLEGSARLEYVDASTGSCSQVAIDNVPFTIGRGDSCDLQVSSSCVSREHVKIVDSRGELRVRDLGSTNGTYVNGTRIKDAPVHDGDTIRLGDFELVFHVATITPSRAETLVMDANRDADSIGGADAFHAFRRLQEIVLYGAFPIRPRSIVQLSGEITVGFAVRSPHDAAVLQAVTHPDFPCDLTCRQLTRFGRLYRLAAARRFRERGSRGLFVLSATGAELDHISTLHGSLAEVIAELPDETLAVLDVPTSYHFSLQQRQELNELVKCLGCRLGLGDFMGGPAALLELEDLAPALVTLSGRMVSDAHRGPHHRRQLSALIDACRRMSCKLLVDGRLADDELDFCGETGLEYVVRDTSMGARTSMLFDLAT